MAKLYDGCNLIFKNHEHMIIHSHDCCIRDFDDYIEIETTLVLDKIDRGWMGEIRFDFNGLSIENYNGERNEHELVALKDVLCTSRTFNKDFKDVVVWTYKFLKY